MCLRSVRFEAQPYSTSLFVAGLKQPNENSLMLNELEQFRKDLLESVRQMKAGKAARVTEVPRLAPAEARPSVTSHPDQ
ncbi:hypothetical protein PMI25_001575 [Pseudomonas sp. GM30]|nr:hypothetical protein PMI25_001575 [Pseudomonas sp. GM30]